jgi:hypothetical protein
MTRLAALVGAALLTCYASAQGIPKLPKTMAGVIDIPNLEKQPTNIVEPVYPATAREQWIQGKIVLDVVIGKTGAVEMIGCDEYCRMSPNILTQAAATAVRQWRWNPLMFNAKPVRVRTKVAVNFVLDETSPPIDVCTVIRDSAFFDRRVVNVSGTLRRVGGLKLLRSSHCDGSVVIADDADSPSPLKDKEYITFEQALRSAPVAVSLRGEFQDDKSPGELGGKRLVVERVLEVGKDAASSH